MYRIKSSKQQQLAEASELKLALNPRERWE